MACCDDLFRLVPGIQLQITCGSIYNKIKYPLNYKWQEKLTHILLLYKITTLCIHVIYNKAFCPLL
jgi:hypothetical protein